MTGFTIRKRTKAVGAEIVDKYRSVPVANVSDVMARMTAGGAALRPMHNGTYMCGPAVTVKTRPGDNLMIHAALDLADPGDVVVVDAGGDLTNALIGELMVAHARTRKLGGLVIFGAIRDSAAIAAGDFPVYALGVTHRGPYRDGPGEINLPIALDGMVVRPGDLVIGDADGMLAVDMDEAELLLQAALEKSAVEGRQMAAFRAGTANRGWVGDALRKLGCQMDDDLFPRA